MNQKHFFAFLLLRWRIRVNQIRRTGKLNLILSVILLVCAAIGSAGLFIFGIFAGWHLMPEAAPIVRLLVWDGAIAFFLFVWMIGLMADLARTDAIALDKVLHLPVSPTDAFLINYLSSLFSITLLMFVPGLIGLAIGQAISLGARMLLILLLEASFVFALTAITYQFQSWLASLMTNPRRRRTIMVLVPAVFVLIFQLPNLLNVFRPWESHKSKESIATAAARTQELERQLNSGEITQEEYAQHSAELREEIVREPIERASHLLERIEPTARLINYVFPPAWLPLGAADLADGHPLPALFGGMGLALIGAVSLRRAYRTTLRSYTQTGSGASHKAAPTEPDAPQSARPLMVEWQLPWVSEYASGVAAASLRGLIRAPEVKMFLIAPAMVLIILGGMLFSMKEVPGFAGPFIALGVMTMVLVTSMQLITNQFGFDRDGFRVYVLSPTPRREILLGKNLALAPVIMGFVAPVVLVAAILFHLSVDQTVAALFQLATMYLLFCLLGNTTTIIAPFAVPAGSLKGARPPVKIVLLQMGLMLIFPIVVGIPVFLPVLVELLLVKFAKIWFPASLLLSALVLLLTVWVYRRMLSWQGRLFAEREQTILEAVTGRVE